MADEASDGEYPEVGEVLGHYSIGTRIGAGGMGRVFEALDTRLHRRVAVKVIAPGLAGDAGFRERFTREATAQASVDSPHVVQVHDHGEVDGRLYLVTQYVPDGDLGTHLREQGPPPRRAAVDLAAQVAAGLADVHAAGLVHRDVKPSNVLLRRREEGVTAYLGDFGVVREAAADDTAPTAGSTGTPRFMAPELSAGASASPRTDVYSLGCLLWTLLTGAPPYDGRSEWEVVSAHRDEPVRQLPGEGSFVEGLNRVLARALAKDPAERYPDARPLRDDLRTLLALPEEGYVAPVTSVDPPVADPLPPPRHARAALVALVVALLVLAVAGVVAWTMATGDDGAATGGAGPGSAPVHPQQAAAVASLAEALDSQGLVTGAVATCTARGWVDAAGLEQMVDAGFFDDDFSYVDLPSARLSAEMRVAVLSAVGECVDR